MRRGGLRPAVSNWRKIVEDYFNSGESPSTYCSRKNLPVSTLSTWRKRYKERIHDIESESFQKVKFSKTVSSELSIYDTTSSGITLHIDNNIRISLSRSFDASSLQKVIKVFRDEIC